MTLLAWRDGLRNSPEDKRALSRFQCTSADLRTELSLGGVTTTHPRKWEYRVQALIQNDVRKVLGKRAWIVRLGFDSDGLGGVSVAQEIDAGEHYDLVLGAIAIGHRKRHRGALGDEMLEDIFAAIGDRCASAGHAGEVRVTGIVHPENMASKRMCERNGFQLDHDALPDDVEHEDCSDDEAYEPWFRMLPIPDIPLFEDL